MKISLFGHLGFVVALCLLPGLLWLLMPPGKCVVNQ